MVSLSGAVPTESGIYFQIGMLPSETNIQLFDLSIILTK